MFPTSLTIISGDNPEQRFWEWFQKNEESLYNFEKDQDKVFDKLSKEMNKVNSDLTFEFSPVKENGKREFVISAGGIITAFPSVQALYATAPELKRWEFIKFRPRRVPINPINYANMSMDPADVHYKMFEDGEKVGIMLFLDGYNKDEHVTYATFGYLFLDEALGEYEIETKVSFIEFLGRDSEHFDDAQPLENLREAFDDYFGDQ